MAQEIGLGLLGFGTVGSGILSLLESNRSDILERTGVQFRIQKIAVRNLNKHPNVDPALITDNPLDVVNDPNCNMIAEVMGGEEPALECICAALAQQKPVATANKMVIAKHFPAIEKCSIENGTAYRFEAAVCAGMPVLSAIQFGLSASSISGITGIINGTTNFILTQMKERNLSYDQALIEAQSLGYAEADPSSDVEGWDAAYKLSILGSLATNLWIDPEAVHRKSITSISPVVIEAADALGCKVKLAARFSNMSGTISASVQPVFVISNHPLYEIDGTENTVVIDASPVGKILLRGSGAGGGTTASGVVSDLITLAANSNFESKSAHTRFQNTARVKQNNDTQTKFAIVSEGFGEHTIRSLESKLRPIQILNSHELKAGAVFLTEPCPRGLFLDQFSSLPFGEGTQCFEVLN